jgi:hypothetical protein
MGVGVLLPNLVAVCFNPGEGEGGAGPRLKGRQERSVPCPQLSEGTDRGTDEIGDGLWLRDHHHV